MKSLFIVSLPRSLSTQIHAMSCAALGLASPTWASAGEIMNADRSVLAEGRAQAGLKFIAPDHRDRFLPALDFLSAVVAPDGFCYKDVVQPFVTAAWLRDHPDVAVLKIRPNLAHVAFAMLARNWLYPVGASVRGDHLRERMMSGLARAAAAIDSVPGEAVAFDEAMFGCAPLRDALGRLYPDRTIPPLCHEPAFAAYRDDVLRRRELDAYRELQGLAQDMGAAGV